ncbi:MAG: CoA transferase [Candidatus Rokubacteria bacterium]|nr:CoA transferase [Candidatus Rokubacteria bacterium]
MSRDGEEPEPAQATSWARFAREFTDPALADEKPEALAHLRVLDCSQGNFASLFCSSILAEFGAEVIRVEPPSGDVARLFTPEGFKVKGTGLPYLVEARNKRHVTLNLEAEEGRRLFTRLARHVDVVIESELPGRMDAWGIGYRQLSLLNPGLVYIAFSTYGQFGPRAAGSIPAYDVTEQALTGVPYVTGEPEGQGPPASSVPTKQGNWITHYVAGAFGAQAVLAALIWRWNSGRGQFIDLAPPDAHMRFSDAGVTWYHIAQRIQERVGALHIQVFPYTLIKTRDSYSFVAGFSDPNWTGFTNIMGRPDLRERFPSPKARIGNAREVHQELEAWSANLTAEEILERFQDYMTNKRGPGTVATARLNRPLDTLKEGHWWERGVFEKVEDPDYGELLLQMPPWKMSRTPPRIKWACRPVGADNDLVYLKYLGIGRERIQELKTAGVV